jgi:hypothetical protein
MGIMSKIAPVAKRNDDIFYINSNLDGGWSSDNPEMRVDQIQNLCVEGIELIFHIKAG